MPKTSSISKQGTLSQLDIDITEPLDESGFKKFKKKWDTIQEMKIVMPSLVKAELTLPINLVIKGADTVSVSSNEVSRHKMNENQQFQTWPITINGWFTEKLKVKPQISCVTIEGCAQKASNFQNLITTMANTSVLSPTNIVYIKMTDPMSEQEIKLFQTTAKGWFNNSVHVTAPPKTMAIEERGVQPSTNSNSNSNSNSAGDPKQEVKMDTSKDAKATDSSTPVNSPPQVLPSDQTPPQNSETMSASKLSHSMPLRKRKQRDDDAKEEEVSATNKRNKVKREIKKDPSIPQQGPLTPAWAMANLRRCVPFKGSKDYQIGLVCKKKKLDSAIYTFHRNFPFLPLDHKGTRPRRGLLGITFIAVENHSFGVIRTTKPGKKMGVPNPDPNKDAQGILLQALRYCNPPLADFDFDTLPETVCKPTIKGSQEVANIGPFDIEGGVAPTKRFPEFPKNKELLAQFNNFKKADEDKSNSNSNSNSNSSSSAQSESKMDDSLALPLCSVSLGVEATGCSLSIAVHGSTPMDTANDNAAKSASAQEESKRKTDTRKPKKWRELKNLGTPAAKPQLELSPLQLLNGSNSSANSQPDKAIIILIEDNNKRIAKLHQEIETLGKAQEGFTFKPSRLRMSIEGLTDEQLKSHKRKQQQEIDRLEDIWLSLKNPRDDQLPSDRWEDGDGVSSADEDDLSENDAPTSTKKMAKALLRPQGKAVSSNPHKMETEHPNTPMGSYTFYSVRKPNIDANNALQGALAALGRPEPYKKTYLPMNTLTDQAAFMQSESKHMTALKNRVLELVDEHIASSEVPEAKVSMDDQAKAMELMPDADLSSSNSSNSNSNNSGSAMTLPTPAQPSSLKGSDSPRRASLAQNAARFSSLFNNGESAMQVDAEPAAHTRVEPTVDNGQLQAMQKI